MHLIKTYYNKFKKVGTSADLSYDDSKRIVVSNQIMGIYFSILFPYFFIFAFMGSLFLSFFTIGIAFFILVAFWFNYRQQFILARSLFLIVVSLPIYFVSAIIGPGSGIEYVSFMTMIISFMLFDDKQWLYRIVFALLQVGIFYGLALFDYAFFYKVSFSAVHLEYLRYSVILVEFLVIFFCLVYYSQLTIHFKKTLDNVSKLQSLTNRESEIIRYICEGKSNKDIGEHLYIEVSTVKTHVSRIYKKLNVSNRMQLLNLMVKK
ncbi:hypothetical protein DID75_02040 [Candidatus Marinamargulisbacteria bacterium SCGC AG-410-N11]|nr:hypothetical protein DID75_02040 [Candidatus Marinamargulisbacteria bacterium SCGC AG-410-N11]